MALADDDAPFCQNPADSFTLPARFYLDDDIYQKELDAIFYRNWWYAGHVSQLGKSGDYLTANVGDQNVFVVRDRDGDLRAFYNVCQHRGHELLNGAGRTNVIVCPYHAWSYDLDGSLVGARNTAKMAGFSKCDFSLKPVQVEVFAATALMSINSLLHNATRTTLTATGR